jgi:hypothetical protein
MDDDNKKIQFFMQMEVMKYSRSVGHVGTEFKSIRRMCPTSPWVMKAEKISETLQIQSILTSFTTRDN